ncbi:MAG: tetratricopeptide repeat protein [Anaerolineae bacterium]|nr:tetratricopeptide repeat protein [Anaerolineae bacterium]
MSKKFKIPLLVIGAIVLLGITAAAVPGIRDRIAWRVEQARVRIFYALFPPEEAVFTPNSTPQNVDEVVQATFHAATALANIAPTFTAAPQDNATPTAAVTPTPLPSSFSLQGVRYEDQHGLWNYCAPATLSMGLSFWGWEGNRVTAGEWLKPFEKDKNVMPYEMQAFVEEQTSFKAALRSGGTLELVKKLIVGGYPVLIEKGTYIRETTTGRVSWMGHYNVLTGYDDGKKQFIAQDSYYSADYPLDYSLLQGEWRAFNYVFMVIYPPEQEARLMALLGEYADAVNSQQIAARIASDEIASLSGVDQFFAWFNRGSSLVQLQDYAGAAQAYDEAFRLYPNLERDLRPWRIMWYQTGPYFAYYYSGRYQDVIDLATTTLDAASEPYLEENFYWRARARAALGDTQGAVDDLRTSLKYHPNFSPSVLVLQEMGYSP